MTTLLKQYSPLVAGLVFTSLLYGCSDKPSVDLSNEVQHSAVKTDATALNLGDVVVSIEPKGAVLHYRLSTLVGNGCYSKGGVEEKLMGNNQVKLVASINYSSGICSQALKALHFSGALSTAASQMSELTVDIVNHRKGEIHSKVITLGH